MVKVFFSIWILLLLSGCSREERTQSAGSMKCGAGKCGANMFDGAVGVDKKKKQILSQLREDDPRIACVIEAPTVKAVYDCVRDPATGRLSTQCGSDTNAGSAKCGGQMQCGAGKCGGN